MTLAYAPQRRVAWKPALAAAALVIAAMGLGQIATTPNLSWYSHLAKPWFTPPNFVFGPVWTALYALMGYLFYRIVRLPETTPGRGAAIGAFVVYLVANTAWSFAFFAAHSPTYGLVDVVAQILTLAAAMATFGRVDALAGASFLPVAMWVLYAGALNYEIWWMN